MAALSLARMTAGVLDKADIGSLRPAPRFCSALGSGFDPNGEQQLSLA
jgi:hypothetical protein